ncbi:MAG: 5,6-dimethylbenzimidazole synthase [Miltoncostaeaceae bacterium]|nr:5,6-dimethylbenzimidazole synthase [Miltoncostaeaceae bacterium]
MRSRFLPDPVPEEVLWRILAAAHAAPSVGLSQPWSFVLVEDRALRQRIRDHVEEQRRRFARDLPPERRELFGRLKVEAILEAPANIAVACDPSRAAPHVLGRATVPEASDYSVGCAIQNLWLAARAEGLGVGWVSFYEPDVLAGLLGLAPPVRPVAYLCLGRVTAWDPEPELAARGWREPSPLADVVFLDRWGRPAPQPGT